MEEEFRKKLESLIKDKRVKVAFWEIPRHEFVLPKYRQEAYVDEPLLIGWGQTISQPSLVATMTQALKLEGDEKVLEIGTGSGYQAAILSKLSKEVYTIERIEGLARRAVEILKRLKIKNIEVRVGDGSRGLKEEAPFQAIMVTAGVVEIPKILIEQLDEGGRIVVPVGVNLYYQELLVGIKEKGKMKYKSLGGVRFVPLIGENKE